MCDVMKQTKKKDQVARSRGKQDLGEKTSSALTDVHENKQHGDSSWKGRELKRKRKKKTKGLRVSRVFLFFRVCNFVSFPICLQKVRRKCERKWQKGVGDKDSISKKKCKKRAKLRLSFPLSCIGTAVGHAGAGVAYKGTGAEIRCANGLRNAMAQHRHNQRGRHREANTMAR